jgi:alkylation response protein AidB-like acyl-CoA dehydrogenase
MDAQEVLTEVRDIAAGFAADRKARLARTALEQADFDALQAAGVQLTGLPESRGGLWRSATESARDICEIYRTLAHGDSSVALVAAMHAAVLAFWLSTPEAPAPHADAWTAQRSAVFDTVGDGAWWGTITSEPGSGGDVLKSKTRARPDGDHQWRLSGQKHFGSGSGMTDYMLTSAVPEGAEMPDWFYVPIPGRRLDGSSGISVLAPWDGHGMPATQSHALTFDDCVAHRFAWPGHLLDVVAAAGPFVGTVFTAVVLGIVETAVETARAQLEPRGPSLRPFELVEWAQADAEAWTVAQVYDGMLRAIESGRPARGAVVRGKTMAAQLSESALLRICRVMGGGTFARQSPFGRWFEDVRALGFLRPPWGLAYDQLIEDTWSPTIG